MVMIKNTDLVNVLMDQSGSGSNKVSKVKLATVVEGVTQKGSLSNSYYTEA